MSFRFEIEIGWKKAVENSPHEPSAPSEQQRVGWMPARGWNPPQPRIKHPQPQCRLLNLPAEIRLMIYETLFQEDGKIEVQRHSAKAGPSILSLLQTRRQVLDEAEDIYYTINSFKYNPNEHGRTAFAKVIGPNRRDAITSMSVVVKSGAYAHAILPDLYGLVNLRSLRIERMLRIRYISLSEWSLMTEQIRRVLVQMPNLREVKMITPSAKDVTAMELQGQPKLDEIDRKLEYFRVAPPNRFAPTHNYGLAT